MAKKKKKASPRRRRVGAVRKGSENISLILGGVVGGIATSILSAKVAPAMDPKIKNAAAAVVGFLVSKSKSNIVKGVGLGMGIAGASGLVASFMPAAVGAIGYGDGTGMAGFEAYPNSPQLNTIAGFANFPNSPQNNVIAGVNAKAATACGIC